MSALDYPVALQLGGKRVVLVGAGRIAEARLHQLLEVGALVQVIAPRVSAEIRGLAAAERVALSEREYRRGDCEGAFVIFTAADDAEVNRAVVAEARALNILVNAADAPELCDFTVPSIGRRGPVTIAVSTSGQAPALARALRLRALDAIGPEFGSLARLIGRLRRLEAGGPLRTHKIQKLVDSNAAELIASRDFTSLWKHVRTIWRGQPLPAVHEQPSAEVSQ